VSGSYFRARVTTPRRAALGHGGLFVDSVAEGLAAHGLEVFPFDFERWSVEEIQRAMERYDPNLVVHVNYCKGLAEFCEGQGR
jgi:hypothetical protein